MKKLKRLIAIFVVVSLILSLLPLCLNAQDDDFYVGRQALSQMPNAEALLYAYDKIVEGVENTKEEISVYDNVNKISVNEIKMVFEAYRNDHAEHFWLGNSYSYSLYSEAEVVSFNPSYIISGAELENARTEFEDAIDEILSGVTKSMSDYEKELYFHDKIADMVIYNTSANAHNAYGALVEGVAVCEGYSEALQVLLHRAGIKAYLVTGYSFNPSTNVAEGHEWNAVEIDGSFYYVDLTWDDQGEKLFHAYFNISESVLLKDHIIDSLLYEMPSCTEMDMFYFNVEGGIINELNVNDVSSTFDNLYNGVLYMNCEDNFGSWLNSNIYDLLQKLGISHNVSSYSYSTIGNEYKIFFTPIVIYGDLNDDGAINKKDELTIRKYLADLAVEINLDAADVFLDGKVNKKDLLLLKQYLAGWSVQLGQ